MGRAYCVTLLGGSGVDYFQTIIVNQNLTNIFSL